MSALIKHINQPQTLDTHILLASTIHDMKNSLGMMMHAIDKVVPSADRLPGDLQKDYASYKLQAQAVNDQMQQLLTLYRIDQSQYFLNTDQHYLQDFLYAALEQHEQICQLSGRNLHVTCQNEDLDWFFDQTLVMGMINNALNNCYKYGGNKIRVDARVQNSYLAIRIMDNGNGFPDTILQQHSSKRTIDFKQGGTGLGLYFSEVCAKLHTNKGHEGKLILSNLPNENGSGSCFTILLP